MRLLFILLVYVVFTGFGTSFGVSDPEPVKIRAAFVDAVNAGEIKAFYTLFNTTMQERNTLSYMEQTIQRIKQQLGTIRTFEFLRVEDKVYIYKSIHKFAALKVEFEIDETGQLAKMAIGPYDDEVVPPLARNITELILPFHGDWYVFWGGTSVTENYHNAYPSMVGAFDFIMKGPSGKSHKDNPKNNADFYAFGKDIIAPAAGKIVFVSDGVADNVWPAMNREVAYGNAVMLETENKEYFMFAHLKVNSIQVREGQHVRQGDVLGQCGNSGNSTEPHLHFQMQNTPDLVSARASQMYFKSILVHGEVKTDYVPRRGEVVRNH